MTTPAADAVPAPERYSWQTDLPRTAGTRRRTLAFALDTIVVFLLAWTTTFVAAALGLLRIPDVDFNGVRIPVLGLFSLVSIFELPILLAYGTLFEWRNGRTPGKILARLRVAKLDGTPLTLFDSFLRNLLRLLWVNPLGPAFILLDAWSLRATELDQRLGDLAAGTIVVDEREERL